MPCQHPPFFESYLLLLLPTVPYFFVPFILRNFLTIHRKTTLSGFIFDDLSLSHDYFFCFLFLSFFSNLVYRTQHTIYIPCLLCMSVTFLHAYFFFFGGIAYICRENWKEERKGERKVILTTPTLALFPSIYLSIYLSCDMWAWEQ
jgi:hypothetical protein